MCKVYTGYHGIREIEHGTNQSLTCTIYQLRIEVLAYKIIKFAQRIHLGLILPRFDVFVAMEM